LSGRVLKPLLVLGFVFVLLVFVLVLRVGHRVQLCTYFRVLHCTCDKTERDYLAQMFRLDQFQLSDLPLMQR
jgi:hypothetical protein